ncbi:hypothetical protein MUK42_05894 [Musa troglodytarum]|uniref:Uncharacterized protein n=1 Tax=Musa troglodytarum TaxID=320322 RepID=A0A9E7GHC1_9LILI|nr:hypothetical protein MUK42_05894 [Musa troglodytarum]
MRNHADMGSMSWQANVGDPSFDVVRVSRCWPMRLVVTTSESFGPTTMSNYKSACYVYLFAVLYESDDIRVHVTRKRIPVESKTKGGRARRQMNRSDDGPHTRQNEADTRAQSSPQGKGWAGKVMVRRGFPEPGPSES